MIPIMDLQAQYNSIKDKINEEIIKVMSSGQYILGKTVEDFEMAFASYCGVKYGIGVGNGSDALIMALRACGIGQDDEVITTDMSYIATAEAIRSVGSRPVFVDISEDIYTIDVNKIEERITEKTKAIIPVHLYGQCCDMDAINNIADKYNLFVIEDAAQAAGAEYNGHKAGSMGNVACFSFFPTKNLGCAGDGGMILTNDEGIYKICKSLRAHGSGNEGLFAYNHFAGRENIEDFDFQGNLPKYYTFIDGYNSRLDAIQAAILKVKLSYLDKWNDRRSEIANFYNKNITNELIIKPLVKSYNKHVYYVYTIITEDRNALRQHLEEHGIKSGVYFPVPMHQQYVFNELGYKYGDFPNAELIAEQSLVIPIFPELTDDEINIVVDSVNSWRG